METTLSIVTDEMVDKEVERVDDYIKTTDFETWALPYGIDTKRYVEYILLRKKKFIERWNGPYKEYELKGLQTIPCNAVDNTVNRVLNTWSNYHPHGLSVEYGDFLETPVSLHKTRVRYGWSPSHGYLYADVRANQRISRAVLNTARKTLGKEHDFVRLWERIFEELGHVWAAAKPMKIRFSVSPADWLWLGDLGEDSCYGAGRERMKSKVNLSLFRDSVVVFIKRDGSQFNPGEDGSIHGRVWGFMNGSGAVYSNIYLLPWSTCLPALTKGTALDLGLDAARLNVVKEPSVLNDLERYAYLNDDAFVITHDDPKKFRYALRSEIRANCAEEVHLDPGESCDDDYDGDYDDPDF